MTAVVELGGKKYKRVEGSTVKYDFWLMARVREAGADRVDIRSKRREDVEEAIEDLLDRIVIGGHALTLLSGLLIPADMEPRDWKPEVAAEIEAHLEQLTEAKDKTQIRPLVAGMLSGFFASGLASLKISPTSSGVEKEEAEEPGSASAGD